MRAYKETYLNNAAKNFGSMLDYAVNDCQIAGGLFLHMFITSGIAEQFERGNPKIVAGKSGVELAIQAVETATGTKPAARPKERDYRTEEYWAGWALARYQWHSAMTFSAILRFLPFDDIIRMYPTLHEADISKFFTVADEIRAREVPQTNLKRIREAAGFSQSMLASQADVSLRSIQMYEQRNKNINKAQVITLAKIARVLSCDIEDLLEIETCHHRINP
jgi:DNA-binding XRE family transcriptional regulator